MRIVFTKHALQRMRKRKLLEHEIVESIQSSDKMIKKHGLYYFQKRLGRGKIEIACEKTQTYIRVITVYWV